MLEVGEKVKVKVLSITSEDKKLELSIKEADPTKIEEIEKYSSKSDDEEAFTIGDMLKAKGEEIEI